MEPSVALPLSLASDLHMWGRGERREKRREWILGTSLLPSRLVLSCPIFPVSAQCWGGGLGVGPSGLRWHQARTPSPGTTPVSTIAPLWGSPSPPCFPNYSSVASGLHGVCGLYHVNCQAGGTRGQGLVLQHAPLFLLSGHLGSPGSHFYLNPAG